MRLTFAGKGALLLVGAGLAVVTAGPGHLADGAAATAGLLAADMAADPVPRPGRYRSWSCRPLM